MIEATDIRRARESNTVEITEAGSPAEWFTRQGFAAEDVASVGADVTLSLISLAVDNLVPVDELFQAAFMAGLAIGWTLHRDCDG